MNVSTPERFTKASHNPAEQLQQIIDRIEAELNREDASVIVDDGFAHIFIDIDYDSMSDTIKEAVKESYKSAGWKNVLIAKCTDSIHSTSIHLLIN